MQLQPVKLELRGDYGSLAPLGIGLSLLSVGLVIAVIAAGSLYVTERRLTSVAESAALATLVNSKTEEEFTSAARKFLASYPLDKLSRVELIEANSPDGESVRVRLCASWQAPVISYVFSDTGIVCSEGLARRGR